MFVWDDKEWLNVERWIEWGGRSDDPEEEEEEGIMSDSERLIDMDVKLHLIDRRLREIGDVMKTHEDEQDERPESPNALKYHRSLGPVGGEQHCDPTEGCSSTLKYFECAKCPSYPVLSAEAVRVGAGAGPQLIEGFVRCRAWKLGTVKTFPLKKGFRRWFRLHPEVLRTRRGGLVRLVVQPGDRGINIVRGELLGRCQKLSQEVADRSSANSNDGCRAELQWDENEEMILRPNVPYKMHFRLFDPGRYFAPLDQVAVVPHDGDLVISGAGLLVDHGAPIELTVENVGDAALSAKVGQSLGRALRGDAVEPDDGPDV